jgi:hypothetical protein
VANRLQGGGDGGAVRGLIDTVPVGEGCTLFTSNPQHPPPEGELPFALAQVLQKWMGPHPVRVRATLPVVSGGHTVALFVWWDRTEQDRPEGAAGVGS